MRVNRSLLNWGVFLIALGGVPLAVQQGWADTSIAGDLWRLWPLILVGIGLGLIMRWTPLAWFGGAIVAGTFGLIFGALIAGGFSGISRALADAKRLCVLEILSGGERSVSDLSREASCQVPNMSQHLAVLRSAGLVETRRDGNTVYYRLSDPRILEAYRLIQSVAS